MSTEPGSITTLVNDLREGRESRAAPALDALHEALAVVARERLRTLGADCEIRTGDLVNEAYLKLFGRSSGQPWESRRHFYGSASRAMEQVIVDLARHLGVRQRHQPRIAKPAVTLPEPFANRGVVELSEALAALEALDPESADLVRIRFFVGLGMEDTAKVLGMPLRSVQRKWTLARGWLLARMSDGG